MVGIFCRLISITPVETILAIETSVPEASVALWSAGEWLFKGEFASDRNHNSMVFDALGEALEALAGRALSAVLVGTGPGSYSGTRIGIAAAQGVAIARACPVAGLGSLAATPVARAHAEAMAVGDARRGLYFVSPITDTGEAMEAELMEADAFSKHLTEASGCALFTLDELEKLGLDPALLGRVTRTRPEAALLVDIWLGLSAARRDELCSKPLSPSYLRAPFTSRAKPGHPLLRKG